MPQKNVDGGEVFNEITELRVDQENIETKKESKDQLEVKKGPVLVVDKISSNMWQLKVQKTSWCSRT